MLIVLHMVIKLPQKTSTFYSNVSLYANRLTVLVFPSQRREQSSCWCTDNTTTGVRTEQFSVNKA